MTTAAPPLVLARPWRVVGHLTLLLLCLSVLLPMAVVVGIAFKPPGEIYLAQPWPTEPTLRNFEELFGKVPFALYLWNSIGSTALRVAGQLLIALLAAYAFVRWDFRGRDTLFVLVLGAMMIPHQLAMLPVYLIIARLDWFDSWSALVVPNLAMPFAAFLLRQHMKAFPPALIDAATIDGAGPWRTLWLVIVPNLGPALAALVIVLWIDSWNEYFWPLLVTESREARTIQIGLREFIEEHYGDYGALMAGVTLASLPALAIFLAFQRRVIATFVTGGTKG